MLNIYGQYATDYQQYLELNSNDIRTNNLNWS